MNDFENAMERLRDEMAKHPDHPGVAVLGEYLTERLQADRTLAPALLAKEKTLMGAFDSIRSEMRKKAVGGMAYCDDSTAFGIACRYYGIDGDEKPRHPQALAPEDAMDDLDLDSLLGR